MHWTMPFRSTCDESSIERFHTSQIHLCRSLWWYFRKILLQQIIPYYSSINLIKFIIVYLLVTDIFKNFDCLKKARPFTVQQCDNGKCENENDATTILAQKADKLYAEGQYDELKILFTNNCK